MEKELPQINTLLREQVALGTVDSSGFIRCAVATTEPFAIDSKDTVGRALFGDRGQALLWTFLKGWRGHFLLFLYFAGLLNTIFVLLGIFPLVCSVASITMLPLILILTTTMTFVLLHKLR